MAVTLEAAMVWPLKLAGDPMGPTQSAGHVVSADCVTPLTSSEVQTGNCESPSRTKKPPFL